MVECGKGRGVGGSLCADGWKGTVHPSNDTWNMETFVNQYAGPCFTFILLPGRGESGKERKRKAVGGEVFLKP